MKFFILILISITLAFGHSDELRVSQHGTVNMSRYSTLLEKIAKDYRPYAKAYNDTAKATCYVFDFPDVAYFPFECTKINKDWAGEIVYIDPYGGVIMSSTDTAGIEHVMIPTLRYVTLKNVTGVRYFEMFFFKADSTGNWKKERESVRVNMYQNGECK